MILGVKIVLAPYPWQLTEQNDTEVYRSMIMVMEYSHSLIEGEEVMLSSLSWIPDTTPSCLTPYEYYLGIY